MKLTTQNTSRALSLSGLVLGAGASRFLIAWAPLYMVGVLALACLVFARRDL